MKKILITLLLSIVCIISIAQTQEIIGGVALTVGGGTHNIQVQGHADKILITGSGTLTSSWTIQPDGTPENWTKIVFAYTGPWELNGNNITIFGYALTATQARNNQEITALYNGASWIVNVASNWKQNGLIEARHFTANCIPDSALKTDAISYEKLDVTTNGAVLYTTGGRVNELALAASEIPVGQGGSSVLNKSMSGDATMAITGAVTIANDAVDNNKLADFTGQGYIKVGGAAGTPTDVDFSGNGYMGIGDGTDFNSVDITGDIDITSAGVSSITSSVIIPSDLTTDAATEMLVVDVNFETGEVGDYKFKIPFKCTATNIYTYAYKVIAGTDDGTIIVKNNAGTTMTGSTITYTAADPRGTAYNSTITANNAISADDIITITTAKTTAGGKIKASLKLVRAD